MIHVPALAFITLLQLPQTAFAGGLADLWVIKEDRITKRVSSSNPDPNSNRDYIGLAPGQKATIFDMPGPGIITHLWFTYLTDDKHANRDLVLRMWWDGEEAPSVECPIGDFFAVGNGARANVDSEPVQVAAEGRALNCFWPMPFASHARIEVENQGPRWVGCLYFYIDYEALKEPPQPLATFHCQYRQAYPVVEGEDYVLAEITGMGHYVGTVLSWWSVEEGWPGEGDDRFYVDGEKVASIQGTGTEDYFGSAWGFRTVHRGCYGVTVFDAPHEGGRCTAYRWHLHDPIRFTKSLRATIEHLGWVTREGREVLGHRADRFSSAAFWYQTEPHAPFPPLPPASERIPYEEIPIELEASLEAVQCGGTERIAVLQPGAMWSGGGQVFYPALRQEEAWLRVPFQVPDSGRWFVSLLATASWDYGVWDILLDGKTLVRAKDMYSAAIRVEEIPLGALHLEAGSHTLEVRTVGSNPQSQGSGAYIGVDAIVLKR